MKRFLIIAIILLTCAGYGSAQVNNYVIDPTFNTGDYYTKGKLTGLLYREDLQDIYVSFRRSSGISAAQDQSIVDLNGNLLYNVLDSHGGTPHPFREGILNGASSITYRILPPHPNEGGYGVDEEIFAFEYAKNLYSFPGQDNLYEGILILEDTTVLMAGRYATDSINPGVAGYRHLIRIDSIGDPVEGFPDIICEPWSSVTYDIRRANNGKYWLSGEFHLINGHSTNSLARLNADFTVDTSYVSPFLDSDGRAFISQIDSDGNIWILCSMGCNLPTGQVEDRTLIKLTSEGEIDENFNIPDAYTYFDAESDEVFRLPPNIVFEDTDGNFILGGNIMLYNGIPVKRIFKITPNGDLIPEAFENLGADEAEWDGWTFDSEYAEVMINNILRQPDGKLLVGGAFSSFGGEPYSCLVRLVQDGFVSTENLTVNNYDVHVWPNPAKEQINFRADREVLRMDLVTMDGKICYSKNAPQTSETIALPAFLSEGLYLIKFTFQDGFRSTQKIILK